MANEIKITARDLKNAARRRPELVKACLQVGRKEGDSLFIDAKIFGDLRKKYASEVPSKGVGDTIAKMTKAVGIKPCGGCNKRRKKLNKIFPYKES